MLVVHQKNDSDKQDNCQGCPSDLRSFLPFKICCTHFFLAVSSLGKACIIISPFALLFYIMLWISFIIITHTNYTTGIFSHCNQSNYENTVFKMSKRYPKISKALCNRFVIYINQCWRVLTLKKFQSNTNKC